MRRSSLDKRSAEYREGTRFIVVLIAIGILFLSIVVYLTYIELWGKQAFMDNAFNQRQWEQEEKILRGEIVDREGEILAYSTFDASGKRQTRIYPYGGLYCHVIGYNSRVYGKSQLELHYNRNLAGMSDVAAFSFDNIKTGETLQLTLSHKLQKRAKELLGKNKGAIVAIEPKTGEVLCMYSYPDFDPSDEALSKNWETLVADEGAPFLSRATQGLYPPGSTLKTLWALSAIEKGMEKDITFVDEGEITVGGKTIHNAGNRAYGEIDLKEAFAKSSNVAFIRLAMELGAEEMKRCADRFHFGQTLKFELYAEPSDFGYAKAMNESDVAAAAIGQGRVLVTPLHMAMICGAVANKGVMMQPYIVEKSVAKNGIVTQSGKSLIAGRVTDAASSAILKSYMTEVVETGTGTNAAVRGVSVAGKTGTAETGENRKDHAWFIGFAPAENPTIAVAVVLEHGGKGGGTSAAPIAGEIIKKWLE